MSLQQLFDHLDDLVRTPEDVARLDEAILDMAMSGRLVLQQDSDRLNGGGLPANWKQTTLGEVVLEVQTGPFGSMLHKSDYVENGIPVVNPANIQSDRIVPIATMAVSEATKQRLERHILMEGDIVMARRGEMGRCAIVTEKEAGWLCGSGSFVLKPSPRIDSEYLVRVIRSPSGRRHLAGGSVGSTMNNLNHRVLTSLPLLLPPLPEQRRIVAKVDELLAQTRALAANLRRAQEQIVTANQAALHRLESAEDGASLQRAWRTLAGSFDLLYDDPRPLAALRQAILQLAVRGKLVRQEEGDEPAAELVKRIESRRQRGTSSKSSQKYKRDTSKTDPFTTFALPESWTWTKLGVL